MFEWNPIYNLVMKIKKDYLNTYNDTEKSFEIWLTKLNKKEYNDVFECLQTNQCNNLLLIRYGLAEMQSGMWEDKNSIFRECRSIVLDLDKEEIVLCPFRKFFNLNEVEENSLENVLEELTSANVVEITNKLDGSMQNARWYNDRIVMAGSMALDTKNSWRLTSGYFMLTNKHRKMIKENKQYTFIFEYISLQDAHVVLYNKKQEGLYLIGIRNVYTGEQLTYKEVKKFANKYNVAMTSIENITFDKVLEDMKKYKANEKEGWVLNIDGHFIKIKCDDYVHLHRLLDKFSSVNVIIENIAEDRYDDMISKIPDSYKQRIQQIANKIMTYKENMLSEINTYYSKLPNGDKKEVMIWINDNCPNNVKPYVRTKYLGRDFNVLKKGIIGYKKLKDLGLYDTYSALFSDLDGGDDVHE